MMTPPGVSPLPEHAEWERLVTKRHPKFHLHEIPPLLIFDSFPPGRDQRPESRPGLRDVGRPWKILMIDSSILSRQLSLACVAMPVAGQTWHQHAPCVSLVPLHR